MSASCRLCETPLTHSVVDLGLTPLANSYVRPAELEKREVFFPLHARVCECCWLVQVSEFESPDTIFRDYAYFSSFSDSWVEHARRYVETVTHRLDLNKSSFVVELASNDGYLLKHFISAGIACLGVEPALNVAEAARDAGIPTVSEFFTQAYAAQMVAQGQSADLIIGNNVLAQVPQLKDFCRGIALLLKPDGVVTIEFPHLLKTLEKNEFDTVYHEHFSYFSFHAAQSAFAQSGIRLFDVEELPTHGGSLRLYGCRENSARHLNTPAVEALLQREQQAGLLDVRTYAQFHERVERVKRDLLRFLIDARSEGKNVVAYGAPAKGNTLLNFCGIKSDFISYTVDRNPHKQGCFLPGSRIPIFAPEKLAQTRPDYVVILPWNLADEIITQCAYIRQWGGQFVLPIPQLEVL
jgi:hypothetical protein